MMTISRRAFHRAWKAVWFVLGARERAQDLAMISNVCLLDILSKYRILEIRHTTEMNAAIYRHDWDKAWQNFKLAALALRRTNVIYSHYNTYQAHYAPRDDTHKAEWIANQQKHWGQRLAAISHQ